MPLKHREDGEELQHGGGALSADARDTQGIVSVEIVFRRSIGGHVARKPLETKDLGRLGCWRLPILLMQKYPNIR